MNKWLLTLLALSAPGHAGEFVVYGSGALSCGQWQKERRTEADWHQHSQWLQGYLVGRAEMGAALAQTDQEKINLWIDDYCAQHPLNEVLDAARALVAALEATGKL